MQTTQRLIISSRNASNLVQLMIQQKEERHCLFLTSRVIRLSV